MFRFPLSLLPFVTLFVGCASSQNPRPVASREGPAPVLAASHASDPVTELMSHGRYRPCQLQPPSPVPGSSVVEVRIHTNHVIYRLAVMSAEQRRHYPPADSCYIEGVEGEEVSIYFQAADPRSISITTMVPSDQPGQGHVNVGRVILPRRVTLAGRPVTTSVNCWRFTEDMAACEHDIQTDN